MSDLMFINTTSGNIGIVTSIPFSKLEVNGSSEIDRQNLTNQYTLTLKNIGAGQVAWSFYGRLDL